MQKPMRLLMVVMLTAMSNRGFSETGSGDSDRARLQGHWEMVATERLGVREEGYCGLQYEFSDDELKISAGAKPHGSTKYHLDETARPKQIDWIVRDITDAKHIKTEVVKGIYAIEGDRLTICVPMCSPRTPRPTMFKTEKTDDEEKRTIVLETFRRIPFADAAEERKRNEAAAVRVRKEAQFRLSSVISRENQGWFDVDFHGRFPPCAVYPPHWQDLVDLRDIRSLDFRACLGVGDDKMRYLGKLTALESLNLHSTDVGDAGIAQLSGLNNLEELDLSFTSVSDVGLAEVAKMGSLRTLVLRGTSVTENAIEKLRAVKKDLVIGRPRPYTVSQQKAAGELNRLRMSVEDDVDHSIRPATVACQIIISPTQVADSTAARKEDERGNAKLYGKRVEASAIAALLSKLPAPISVTMAGDNTDDSVLKCIRGVQGLVRVSLPMSHITDAGLAQLKEHQSIRVLDLSRAKKITDAGVAGLQSLANLEVVRLNGIKLTPSGVKPLLNLDHLRLLVLDRYAVDDYMNRISRLMGVELKIE